MVCIDVATVIIPCRRRISCRSTWGNSRTLWVLSGRTVQNHTDSARNFAEKRVVSLSCSSADNRGERRGIGSHFHPTAVVEALDNDDGGVSRTRQNSSGSRVRVLRIELMPTFDFTRGIDSSHPGSTHETRFFGPDIQPLDFRKPNEYPSRDSTPPRPSLLVGSFQTMLYDARLECDSRRAMKPVHERNVVELKNS